MTRQQASDWGCIVGGIIALGTFIVWLFGIKPSPTLAAPAIALAAALVCGTLFYLGKRIENKTSAKRELELRNAEKPLPASPIPPLRLKILETCTELQSFLAKHGNKVKLRWLSTDINELIQSRIDDPDLRQARIKFAGEYRLAYREPVMRLRDEIKAKCGISEAELDDAIHLAQDGGTAASNLETVIDRFWQIALKVNV